jgi:hypothetical protein
LIKYEKILRQKQNLARNSGGKLRGRGGGTRGAGRGKIWVWRLKEGRGWRDWYAYTGFAEMKRLIEDDR